MILVLKCLIELIYSFIIIIALKSKNQLVYFKKTQSVQVFVIVEYIVIEYFINH